MSAWLSPICGRDLGSELSILTTSVGRAATAGSATGRPVSGYTGGGGGAVGGGVVVVVVVLVVVVVVVGAAPSDPIWLVATPAVTSTRRVTTAATILPRGVATRARRRAPTPPGAAAPDVASPDVASPDVASPGVAGGGGGGSPAPSVALGGGGRG